MNEKTSLGTLLRATVIDKVNRRWLEREGAYEFGILDGHQGSIVYGIDNEGLNKTRRERRTLRDSSDGPFEYEIEVLLLVSQKEILL